MDKDNEINPELLLTNHPHFLVPMKMKAGKMLLWGSICSAHRSHDATCNNCNAGWFTEIKFVDEDE